MWPAQSTPPYKLLSYGHLTFLVSVQDQAEMSDVYWQVRPLSMWKVSLQFPYLQSALSCVPFPALDGVADALMHSPMIPIRKTVQTHTLGTRMIDSLVRETVNARHSGVDGWAPQPALVRQSAGRASRSFVIPVNVVDCRPSKSHNDVQGEGVER
jgi:hypothetical protein